MKHLTTFLVIFCFVSQGYASPQLITDYKEQYLRTMKANPSDGSYVAAELHLLELEDLLRIKLGADKFESIRQETSNQFANQQSQFMSQDNDAVNIYKIGLKIENIKSEADANAVAKLLETYKSGFSDAYDMYKENIRNSVRHNTFFESNLRLALSFAALSLFKDKKYEGNFEGIFINSLAHYMVGNTINLSANEIGQLLVDIKSTFAIDFNSSDTDRILKKWLIKYPNDKKVILKHIRDGIIIHAGLPATITVVTAMLITDSIISIYIFRTSSEVISVLGTTLVTAMVLSVNYLAFLTLTHRFPVLPNFKGAKGLNYCALKLKKLVEKAYP